MLKHHEFMVNLRWFMLWIQRFYRFLHPIFFWGIPTLQFSPTPKKIHEKSLEIPVLVQVEASKIQLQHLQPTHFNRWVHPKTPTNPYGFTQIRPLDPVSLARGYVRFVFEQIFGLNPEGRLGIEETSDDHRVVWFFSWSEMVHKSKLRSCWLFDWL